MDIKAEKLNWIQAILNIEDIGLIQDIKKLLEDSLTNDWFDDLTQEQQQSVLRGLAQLDGGDVITHEEAVLRLGL